jgi:hypothetical protein
MNCSTPQRRLVLSLCHGKFVLPAIPDRGGTKYPGPLLFFVTYEILNGILNVILIKKHGKLVRIK